MFCGQQRMFKLEKFVLYASNKLFTMLYITDCSQWRATSTVTALFLIASTPVSWQPCVDVKTDSRSTAPRTITRRKSRFIAPLERIPVCRMDSHVAVESVTLRNRMLKTMTSSFQTTFQFLRLPTSLTFHRRRPGRRLQVLQSSRPGSSASE